MKIHSHTPVSGTKPVNAVQPQAKKSDPRELAFGAGVPVAGGKPDGAPTADGHARLEAFSKKIEKRFEGALAKEDLSPRQRQALEKERDRFHSMMARFEAAFLDGAEGPKGDAMQGMQKLLQSFGKSVGHIMAGGEHTATTDAPKSTPAATNVRAGGRGREGIDLVG